MNDNLFMLLVELAEADGVSGLNKLPGAWHRRLDGNWDIAVNAHDKPVRFGPFKAMKCEIKPYHCAVWWNGWLAGMFSPYDGVLAAGSMANQETFTAALKKAAERTRV